ncbi:hypothetical protein Tco_0477451 [Tanacetum coccineum]
MLRGANGNGTGADLNCFVLCPWPLLLAFTAVFRFAVMGIHDFLCLLEWTGAEVQEEPHFDVRSTLQWLPFYCTSLAAADVVIPDSTLEDLAVGSSNDESDGDDDACVEISLSFAAPAAEGSNTQDSRGKGIMGDDVAAPSAGPYYATYLEGGVAGNCEFTREEWDAPYRPTFGVLTKEVFKDHVVCKTMVDQFPTPGEMVRVESLSDDQLTAKMSVLHCMMMSHGGELLDRYRGLNQSHHEYMLSADSRLKGYEEKVDLLKAKGKETKKKIKSLGKSLDNLHAEGELLSLAASAGFERGLSMHRTKDKFAAVLKKMVNFMPDAQDKLAEASPLLEPEKLVRSANVPTPRDARVSPPIAKESIVTPASKSLELPANVDLTAFVVASEHNEEMVNAEVDGSDPKMTDDTVTAKSGHAFVHGISVSLDDVVELVEVGSRRVSSGPNDVVVALSAGEKGDGLVLSSTVGGEGKGAWCAVEHLLLQAWGKLTVDVLLSIQRILSHSIRPKPNGFPLGPVVQLFGFDPGALLAAFPFLPLLVSSTDGLVLIPTDTSWLRNSNFIVANPLNTSAFRFRNFGRCVIQNLWNLAVASIISSMYLLSCSVAGVRFP